MSTYRDDEIKSKKVKIEKQMRTADRVYDALRGHYETSLLAGGAPRNWRIGLPAKDLDFYISPGTLFYKWPIKKIERSLQTSFVQKRKPKNYAHPDICSLFEGCVDETDVQLIFLKKWNPSSYIFDCFDFNLCKIAYEENIITSTFEFEYDMSNKKMTLNLTKLSESQIKKVPERLEKMKALFPDYELELK